MHVAHEVVHLGQRLRRLVDHQVGALAHDLEVVVGDERGDLDDHVAVRLEAGHLEVHPDEHRGRIGRCRRPSVLGCSTSRSSASTPTCPLPAYARPGDAGADLRAREGAVLAPGGGRALIPTGIAIALPPGTAGFVQPRSGLALKHGVTCLNTPGPDRLRLPRRAQGDPGQPRPHRAVRGASAATASPSW